jgi:hypothetical protein
MPRSKRPGLTITGKAAELIYGLSRKSGVSPERILENVVKAGVVAVKEMYETLAQAEASFDELLNEKPESYHGPSLAEGLEPTPLTEAIGALSRDLYPNGNDPALPGDTPCDSGATDELAHSTPQEQHSD